MKNLIEEDSHMFLATQSVGRAAVASLWFKEGSFNTNSSTFNEDIDELSCKDFMDKYGLISKEKGAEKALIKYPDITFGCLLEEKVISTDSFEKFIKENRKGRLKIGEFIAKHGIGISPRSFFRWLNNSDATIVDVEIVESILRDDPLCREIKKIEKQLLISRINIGDAVVEYNELDRIALNYYMENVVLKDKIAMKKADIRDAITALDDFEKLDKIWNYINRLN